MHRPSTTVGILAVTQVVSWGSLYYAFTILAPGIRRDLGLAPELAFGAFSWALLVAGVAAAPVGLLLDRHGGRTVMAAGSFLCFLGLAWLGRCTDVVSYYAAWTLIGLAMALTLYEAAFATIQRRLAAGDRARQAISTLTLFGGFASTLSWPLTAWLDTSYGWRATCLSYGIVQLAVCLPLHLCLGADAAAPAHAGAPRGHTLAEAVRHPAFWTLALAFAVNAFVFSAMAVHLIPLFERLGQAKPTAVLLAALIGPMQVAGRVGEMAFARHTAPQTVGKLTFAMLPAALAIIALGGAQAWSVAAFCVLYGLSNGILTILRGALPRALFGREHYGAIAGAMAGPALLAKAAGPLIAATLLRRADGPALLLSVLLAMSLASFAFYLRAVAPDKTFDKRPA